MVIRQNVEKTLLALATLLVAVVCEAQAPVSVTPTVAPTAAVSTQPSPKEPPAVRAFGPEDAIRAALQSSIFGGRPTASDLFPASPGSQDCQIRGGGPAPGILVPGTCRTAVAATASGYVVSFTEVWDGRLFHLAGEASSGQLATTWSFTVSPSGAIVDQAQSGNFPPQYVK